MIIFHQKVTKSVKDDSQTVSTGLHKIAQSFTIFAKILTFSTQLNDGAFLPFPSIKGNFDISIKVAIFSGTFFHRKTSCPDPFWDRDGDFVQIICQKIIRGRNIFLNKWTDLWRRDLCPKNCRHFVFSKLFAMN